MNASNEITKFVGQMAGCRTYDEAWMVGLEIQALGTPAVSAFHTVLEKGTSASRRAAAFWLSDEAEMVPADIFFAMAEDSDGEIRFHAAYCLGYVQDGRTVRTLRRMMHRDRSEEVRQTAAQSLFAAAKINDCITAILDDYAASLAADQSPKVREEVVTNLANFLRSPVIHRAISVLENALNDTHDAVREQAQISLSVLRNEVWNDITATHPL